MFGAFQEEKHYRRSEHRWQELARGADAALVFAGFEAPTTSGAGLPVEVPLSARAPMRREWAVVCDSPGFTAVLTAWELPGQRGVADADRLFESIWTIEPGPVRDAARICARVAHEAGVPEAEDVRRALAADPERVPDPTAGGALLLRVLSYVDRGGLSDPSDRWWCHRSGVGQRGGNVERPRWVGRKGGTPVVATRVRVNDEVVGDGGMRAQVAESWHRSAAAGVSADDAEAPITLADDSLRDHREAHPLAQVFPLLDDVLGQAARDCDAIMAVSDAERPAALGLRHTRRCCARPRAIGFVEGSNWDERLAGTNAPGMALALDQPVSVHRPGALPPVRAPLELRGHADPRPGRRVAARRPRHHRRRPDRGAADDGDGPRRRADGRGRARAPAADRPRPAPRYAGTRGWRCGSRRWAAPRRCSASTTAAVAARTLRLPPRHSEILLLLASAPQGLSGDELAVLLYEEDGAASTLRAELNRLRNLLGDDAARLAALPARRRPRRRLARRRGAARSRATWPVRCGAYRGPVAAALDRAGRRPPPRGARLHAAVGGAPLRRSPT